MYVITLKLIIVFSYAIKVDCESLSDRSLFPLETACPRLTTLNLKGSCYFTDHGFKSLCSLKDLKSLCLAESLVTDHVLDSIVTTHGNQVRTFQSTHFSFDVFDLPLTKRLIFLKIPSWIESIFVH